MPPTGNTGALVSSTVGELAMVMKSAVGRSLSSASPGTYVLGVGATMFRTGGCVSAQNGKLNWSTWGWYPAARSVDTT